MSLAQYFPIWNQLTPEEQNKLESSAIQRTPEKGAVLHNGSAGCEGLFVVCSGQLRVYILSETGKEVTLYRLFERDICLLSASCMMTSLQFDVTVEVEKDARLWMIPVSTYKEIMGVSAVLANYTNQLMASRFSDVMWLMDQVMFKSFDTRLATFLLEESRIDGTRKLQITQERIATHLGTAREVVTRMLKYFQNEGLVSLYRGGVELLDLSGLERLAAE